MLWDYLSLSDIIRNYPHLVVLGSGLAFGFLVIKTRSALPKLASVREKLVIKSWTSLKEIEFLL
ncbi:hypothetical protein MKX01_032541, partial [Papaver californicum]